MMESFLMFRSGTSYRSSYPLLAASHISLSAPGAKLNVAGAYFSFWGGENKSYHVLDSLRACAMFIVSAHVCDASLD